MCFRTLKMLAALMVLAALLAACVNSPTGPLTTGPSPLPTVAASPLVPTKPPTFSKTTGAVVGHVTLPPEWKSARAYLAPFYPDESGKNGFFYLEPSIHRSVDMGLDGYFQVSDVEPAQYVIVIGPSPEETRAIAADNGQPLVIKVEAGKTLDVGNAQLLSQ